MTSRKIIDIANNLDFVYDYNITGITGNNSRITTTSYGEFLLYSTRASTNSSTGSVVLYNGGLSINNTSDVTSITSGGALTIAGGASIKKNLYIGGPGLKIPVGTTAERPGSAENGFVRYNSETNQFEGYGPGNAWGSLGGVVDIAQTTKILASASPSTTDGNLYFYTTGTERMRINSTGNIGIGITAPSYLLDVQSASSTCGIRVSVSNSNTSGQLLSADRWGTGTVFLVRADGNVGIGTTSPNNTLDVNGTGRITTLYSTNQTSTNIVATNVSSSTLNLSNGLTSANALITSSTISTLRNTEMIATNVTSTTLNLSSGLTSANAQITNANITTQTVGTSRITTSLISLGNSNTIGSLFTTAGNIGINKTSPIYRLDINGDIRCVGTSSSLISSNFASNNVLQIQNLSSTGNSVIEFLDQNGNIKLLTGYANQSSNGDGLAASSYIMSKTAVSLNLIAGEQTGTPIILNPTDNSMSITCSTDAVDIYTGALNVAGGVGIANHLYVGDDLHVERDLYVNGAINGAAASSSTFAYMTITATDDAINYSTGSIVTFGGITIQSTADSGSVTNGGSFLTAGGASIRKRLFVGQGITTNTLYVSGTSILNNISSTLLTVGNVITDSINLGVSSMYSGSFTPSNNVTSSSNVTGLVFNNSDIRSFTVNLTASITRITGGNLYEYFYLEGNQTDIGWDMLASSSSDVTGITFTITSGGQIQYTSTNIDNYQNSIFRYHVNQISNTGTYSLTTLQTQGTLITNNVQILSTQDSNRGVNNGSLYIMGGATIDKTLYANTISTGTINTIGLTAGNINFTGNLYKNGELYVSSQWTTDTNGSIFYTSGNVGIGMTNPSFTLDVSGTIRATSGITTNGLNIINDIDNSIGLNISNGHTGGGARSNINIGAGQIYTMKNGDTSFTFRSITQNTNGISILAAGPADIKFSTANAERARITSNGNFGIGTTSPSLPLDVNGTARITTIYSTNQTTSNIVATNISSSNLNLSGNLNVAGTLTVVNITTTNLIDTNLTAANLVTGSIVNSGSYINGNYSFMRFNTGNARGFITHQYLSSGRDCFSIAFNYQRTSETSGNIFNSSWRTSEIQLGGDADIRFLTSAVTNTEPTERMRILNNGNVGIGTIAPGSTLDVVGTAQISTGLTTASARITSNLVAVGNSNTVGSIFTTGGSIGMGVTAPSYALHVNGDICATGDVISFGTISDARLKQNVENIDNKIALEMVNSMRPILFEWKDDIFNKDKRLTKDVGFIAQEIEQVVPYAVSEYKFEENIYKNMKHERLIPYLVASIQSLSKVVSEQQMKIDELVKK